MFCTTYRWCFPANEISRLQHRQNCAQLATNPRERDQCLPHQCQIVKYRLRRVCEVPEVGLNLAINLILRWRKWRHRTGFCNTVYIRYPQCCLRPMSILVPLRCSLSRDVEGIADGRHCALNSDLGYQLIQHWINDGRADSSYHNRIFCEGEHGHPVQA